MLASEIHNLGQSEKSVVLVCRDPRRRALLERIVPAAETHASAIDAMLAIARKDPRAVVVNFQDVEGSEGDVMAALRRARPEVPVYLVVEPEDEAAARRLVQAGPGDYFVMPTDVYRLPRVLQPPPAPSQPHEGDEAGDPELTLGARTAAGPVRERPDQLRLFVSACALADLAQSKPQVILHEGAAIILHALDASRGCLFSWDYGTETLLLATAVGEAAEAGPEQFQAERAAAEQALQANKAILTKPGASRPALLCVPVGDEDATVAVLCVSAKRDGAALDPDDRDAAARLASVLAKLHGAAARLERFATMAVRDAETGLLKADAIETYLTKLIGRASEHHAPVTVILLRPDTSGGPADPAAIAKLGRSLAARLPSGWQGARIGADKFVVVGAPKPDAEPLPQEVAILFATRPEGAQDLDTSGAARLRTGMAEFPKDGSDARTLLAAAAGRLGAS